MTLYIVLILLCLLFSAFFSGSEIAYTSLNPQRLKRLADEKHGSASLALSIHDNFQKALIAILVGNNLVNIAASSLATVIAIGLMGDSGAWVATALMTILILTFGEIIPKIIANEKAQPFAVGVAVPLKGWMLLLWPLTFVLGKLLDWMSRLWKGKGGKPMDEDDFETVLDTVEDEGVVDEDTCELLQSALDFDDTLAYEIITPRVDMVAIDLEDDRETMLRTAFSSPYTRLPVYEGTPDHIKGILHLNRLYKRMVTEPNVAIADVLMEALFVHKTMPLPDVLELMRHKKQHMVIVTDEYGGTMGLLTMEDVLEQLVGDIWDESDEIVDEFVQTGPYSYEVDGDMRLTDFLAEFDKDDEELDDDNATVGGWAVEMLGGYPKLHESFTFEDLTVTIIKRDKLRVQRLRVEVDPALEAEDEEDALIPDE